MSSSAQHLRISIVLLLALAMSALAAPGPARAAAPSNDDFASATSMEVVFERNETTSVDATTEADEPNTELFDGGTVWYRLEGAEGPVSAFGSGDVPFAVVLYRGATMAELVELAVEQEHGTEDAPIVYLDPNEIYYVQVGAAVGHAGPGAFGVFINHARAWLGDAFEQPKFVRTHGSYSFSNLDATMQHGEDDEGGRLGASVWLAVDGYAGDVAITVDSDDFNPVLHVYTGDALDTLNLVTSNDDEYPDTQEKRAGVSFTATGGVRHLIRVSSRTQTGQATPVGEFSFDTGGAGGAPDNDDLASAHTLRPDVEKSGNTFSGTTESQEPLPGGDTNRSIWYQFEADADSTATITTTSTYWDRPMSVAVYTGSAMSSLELVTAGRGTPAGSVSFTAAEGVTYRVQIAEIATEGVVPEGPLQTTLSLDEIVVVPPAPVDPDAPANDMFANALIISHYGYVDGTTLGASVERGEPGDPNSVWYLFDGHPGQLRIAMASPDHLVQLYTGSRVDRLKQVRGDVLYTADAMYAEFVLKPDVNYWVRVSDLGFPEEGSEFTLEVLLAAPELLSYHAGPDADGKGRWWRTDTFTDTTSLLTRFGTASGWQSHLAADFNGDGLDTLVSYYPGPDGDGYGRWWTTNTNTGAQSLLTRFGTAGGWQTHLAADMNGDGVDELLSFAPSNGTWWRTSVGGNGPAKQTLLTTFGTRSGWQTHVAADTDRDGRDELFSYHPSNGAWWRTVVRSDGRAVQTKVTTYGTTGGWDSHLVADVMGDQTPELLSYHGATGRWWLTDLSSRTASQRIYVDYSRVSALDGADWTSHATADLTGDGIAELVSYDQSTGYWWWTTQVSSRAAAVQGVFTEYGTRTGWTDHLFAFTG